MGNTCIQTFEGGITSCVSEKECDYGHLRQYPPGVPLGELWCPPMPLPAGHIPTPETFLGLSSAESHCFLVPIGPRGSPSRDAPKPLAAPLPLGGSNG